MLLRPRGNRGSKLFGHLFQVVLQRGAALGRQCDKISARIHRIRIARDVSCFYEFADATQRGGRRDVLRPRC